MTRIGNAVLPLALRDVFQGLDAAGVPWCLLRPIHGPDIPSGDIDLLVAPGRLDAACAVARARGFVSVPGRSHGRNLLLYDAASPGWLWLHVVDELSFGPFYRLQTVAENACLDRWQGADGVRWLHPADEFWVTLLHCLLDKGAIRPHHRDRLRRLAREVGSEGPIAAVVAPVCADAWRPERLLEWAAGGEWERLDRLCPALLERWPSRAPMRAHPGWVKRVRGAVGYRLRGWHRRGISVALLGPDGAGKTTLAEEIRRGFVFPVRRVYMGLTGGALQYVSRLRVPGVVLLGRLVVLWGRYLYARSLQARGTLVVYDRYVYDAVAPTPFPLSRAQRVSRWLSGHACPSPDLVLVLSAPGEIMYRRKRAYTAEQLEDWRQHFLALEKHLPNLEIVDTTRPLDVVRADVIGRIWRLYATRWR